MKSISYFLIVYYIVLAPIAEAIEAEVSDCNCHLSKLEKIPLAAIQADKRCVAKDNLNPNISFVKIGEQPNEGKVTWTNFGEVFDTFHGVEARSNGQQGLKGKWQCTDLSHRFLNEYFGIPTKVGIGLGHGDQLVDRVMQRFGSIEIKNLNSTNKAAKLVHFNNACSPHAPVVGAVLSLKYSKLGHTGVVRAVRVIDENNLELELFEQHGAKRITVGSKVSRTKLVLKKNVQGNWTHPNLVSWLAVAYK